MKSNILYKSFLALAAVATLTACSSDEPAATSMEEGEFDGIELYVPNNIGTRAVTQLSTEAVIKNLTVVAYPQGGKGEFYKNTFKGSDLKSSDAPNNYTYSRVGVKLKDGDYHIYVFANINENDVLSSTTSDALTIDKDSETALKSAMIGGMEPKSWAKIGASEAYYSSIGLPMSCNYTDMCSAASTSTSSSKFTNGLVQYTKGSNVKVYADLTFCVAKVRLTLINDKVAGLSKPTEVKLTKSTKYVGVMEGISSENYSFANGLQDVDLLSLGQAYDFPTMAEGTSYDTVNLDNLTGNGNNNVWAWQGTWYVPERLYETAATDKSAFHIDFNGSITNDKYVEQFERGHYYDFVGYIDSREVTLSVRVKAWGYHKYEVDL